MLSGEELIDGNRADRRGVWLCGVEADRRSRPCCGAARRKCPSQPVRTASGRATKWSLGSRASTPARLPNWNAAGARICRSRGRLHSLRRARRRLRSAAVARRRSPRRLFRPAPAERARTSASAWRVFRPSCSSGPAACATLIVAAGLGKYGRRRALVDAPIRPGAHILVAGQVEDDRSVLCGGRGGHHQSRIAARVRARGARRLHHLQAASRRRSGSSRRDDSTDASLANYADEVVTDQLDFLADRQWSTRFTSIRRWRGSKR